jgi:hypothetical protein
MIQANLNNTAKISAWGAEHRGKDGKLISRQVMTPEPAAPCVTSFKCILKYIHNNIIYAMTLLYHTNRVEYAEVYRDRDIPIKYRTGEDVPTTIIGLIIAILKIPYD